MPHSGARRLNVIVLAERGLPRTRRGPTRHLFFPPRTQGLVICRAGQRPPNSVVLPALVLEKARLCARALPASSNLVYATAKSCVGCTWSGCAIRDWVGLRRVIRCASHALKRRDSASVPTRPNPLRLDTSTAERTTARPRAAPFNLARSSPGHSAQGVCISADTGAYIFRGTGAAWRRSSGSQHFQLLAVTNWRFWHVRSTCACSLPEASATRSQPCVRAGNVS